MKVYGRNEWTATLPAFAGVDYPDEMDSLPNFFADEVEGVAIHWTGMDKSFATADTRAVLESIRKNDMSNKNYSDIMYNLGVDQTNPGVWTLRGLVNRGAAQRMNGNRTHISIICLVGTKEKVTDQLLQNLVDARNLVLAKYPNAKDVRVHRDFIDVKTGEKIATSCAGDELTKIVYSPAFWEEAEESPVGTYECPVPQVALREGDKNMNVLLLQNHLQFWGYYTVKADGDYGAFTRWGVATLQNDLRNAGLYPYTVDGYYGPKTIEAWCKHLAALWKLANG